MNTQQELTVTGDNSRRNYRGIFISIVVLTLISSLIIASIFLVNPDILKFAKLFQIKEKILLEEAIFDLLSPKHWNLQWLEPVGSQSGPIGQRDDDNNQDTLLFVDQDKEIRLLQLAKQFDTAKDVFTANLCRDQQQPQNSNVILFEPTVCIGPRLNFSTLVSKSSLVSVIENILSMS